MFKNQFYRFILFYVDGECAIEAKLVDGDAGLEDYTHAAVEETDCAGCGNPVVGQHGLSRSRSIAFGG